MRPCQATAVQPGHGGRLAVDTLRRWGVTELFTLSGGHIFPFYDAAVKAEPTLRLVDVRHEQTATFAAEGMAKLTRRPGVAVLTAGPGVTNGISAITTAHFNGSPLVVLGGRAPQARWGAGSLQEFDHVPVVASITKSAAHGHRGRTTSPRWSTQAVRTALTPHRGPVFLDFPLDVVFADGEATRRRRPVGRVRGADPDPDDVAARRRAHRRGRAAGAHRRQRRVLGRGLGRAAGRRRGAAGPDVRQRPRPGLPAGRPRAGLLPDPRHAQVRGRRRGRRRHAARLPPLVRLVRAAQVIHVVDSPEQRAGHVDRGGLAGRRPPHDPRRSGRRGAATGPTTSPGSPSCATPRRPPAAADAPLLAADADPIQPTRIYGELRRRLDRDAVVVCDGGDFVSYAGKYVDSYEPGCWLDPGPYGCLGTGLGYAIAARVAHPDRQVVLMLGDGAVGFSLMDVDTLVRHDLPVVIVCGNNGIWGLEKHPMQMLYGYDVAADLQPGCRYDDVVAALGGAGETVERPDDVGPALDRAFAAGRPLPRQRPHRPRRRLPPQLEPGLTRVFGLTGCSHLSDRVEV